MARLIYYLNEGKVHGTNGGIKLTDVEARYVFQRLRNHYKFNQSLEVWGTGGGECNPYRVRIPYCPSLRTVVHEVAHAIQFRKNLRKKRWHSKSHMKIMARIYKYMMPRLEGWKAMANKKADSHSASVQRKHEKKKEQEEYRKSPKAKLEQIDRNMARWESKRKRAENALKKLKRRKKLWERKANPLQ